MQDQRRRENPAKVRGEGRVLPNPEDKGASGADVSGEKPAAYGAKPTACGAKPTAYGAKPGTNWSEPGAYGEKPGAYGTKSATRGENQKTGGNAFGEKSRGIVTFGRLRLASY